MKAFGSQVLKHQPRDDSRNRGTEYMPFVEASPLDPGELFTGAYSSFVSACRVVAEPGVAMVAIDERTHRLAGLSFLLAQPGRNVAAIVGRHDRCDLSLDGDDALPLRQLALILDPVTSWRAGRTETSYRILDLRSEHGFRDEHGRTLRGLRSDGAAVLRCAGHVLFVLPLGDPTDWPERGGDAWSFLPERIYFDEQTPMARGSSSKLARPCPSPSRSTRITAICGPRDAGVDLVDTDDLEGTLELGGPSGIERIRIGHAALRDGVLLGRYPRCDRACSDDDSVSRVHALLIQVDEALLVIDTASSNGTRDAGGTSARVHQLQATHELMLGARTRARWRSHGSPELGRRPGRA